MRLVAITTKAIQHSSIDIGSLLMRRRDRSTSDEDAVRLAAVEAELAALREAHATHAAAVAGHAVWLTDLQAGVGDIVSGHGQQLQDLSRWLASTVQTLSALSSTSVIPSAALQQAGPSPARVDPLRDV